MNNVGDETVAAFDLLKRMGAKWAVLTAMTADMAGKGIKVPPTVIEDLKTARINLGSGCFSPCQVGCELSKIEGQILSRCHLLEDQYVNEWCDLLAEAAQGILNYERIRGISAVAPVKSDCEFLKCVCSDSR